MSLFLPHNTPDPIDGGRGGTRPLDGLVEWAVASTRPEAAFHLGSGRALQLLAVLGLVLLAGCAAVPEPSKVALARLEVKNLTGYEWRLSVSPVGGGDKVVSQVAARGSLVLQLAGGEYVIKQAALTAGAETDLNRHVTTRFAAGETYEWLLVTLWSELDERIPAPAAGIKP